MHSQPQLNAASDSAPASTGQRQPVDSGRSVRRSASTGQGATRAKTVSAITSRGADYVTIPVAAAMTGYSPKAIRRKIEDGVWLEDREFRRAPDGHVLISVRGYELWVERGRA